jgi:HlyD family secretion protein
MFPVLVNLENGEGLLKPGMNGEVSVLIDERDNVIAIPNDAIKNPREAVATGAVLGLSTDSVNAELKAQGFSGGGNRGGFGGGNRGGNGGNGGGRRTTGGGAGAPGAAAGPGTGGTAGGEVGPTVVQQGGQQGGGGFGQGGFGGMQVSDADCKKIDDALKAHPKEKKQIDDLRAKMQALRPAGFGGGSRRGGDSTGAGNRNRGGDSTQRRRGGGAGGRGGDTGAAQGGQRGGGGFRGSPEMQAINDQLRAIYSQLNIDPRTAGACARRTQGGSASQSASAGGATRQGGAQAGRGGALTPSPEMSVRPTRARTGLVFTSDSAKTSFHPRIVQLGQGNLDYTEVLSGLKEGERVVMLGALALQAQRQQVQDRIRQNASPLGGQPGPGGGGPRGGGRGG